MQPIKTKRRRPIWSKISIFIMAAHWAPPHWGIARRDISKGWCGPPSPPPSPLSEHIYNNSSSNGRITGNGSGYSTDRRAAINDNVTGRTGQR